MALIAGSLRNGGMTSKPIMDLVYDAQIYRTNTASYTGTGSLKLAYVLIAGVVPCDISPLTDMVSLLETGQQEVVTDLIHFPAGTDVRTRDAVKIVRSRTGFGPVGLSFYIREVLLPSETISFVKCRVSWGKEPVPGAV